MQIKLVRSLFINCLMMTNENINVLNLFINHLLNSNCVCGQDHDGSHIKGLLINFIHSFWPSLLRVPSFMIEFITPIVKVSILQCH